MRKRSHNLLSHALEYRHERRRLQRIEWLATHEGLRMHPLKRASTAIMPLIIGGALLVGGQTGALAAGQALKLSSSSGPPTSSTRVSGSGFAAGEAVDVYFDTTDAVLATANSTGAFRVELQVPASAQPRVHYVTAVGRTSGLSAQRTFTVRTNWSEYGFNGTGDNANPYENTLNPGNVPDLQEAFTSAAGGDVVGVSVANGIAYVATFSGSVTAVNATTGKAKWSLAPGGEIDGAPAVSGRVVFFASGGVVYAVKASTGAPVWTDDLSMFETEAFSGAPIVVNGVVYIGGGSGNEYALNAETGFAQWVFPTAGSVAWSAAYSDGQVYVASLRGGELYDLDASTGSVLWSVAVFQPTAPAVANGVVYVGSGDGNVYALNAATGAQVWSYTTGGIAATGLAVSDGTVYAGYYNGYVVAIGTLSGSQNWQTAECPSPGTPAVADGVVYDDCLSYGGAGNNVYALATVDGTELWSAATGGFGDCSPMVVTNGTVYAGCDDDLLHAYSLPVPVTSVRQPNPAQLHRGAAFG
jgi:outer membrane protein assembly factor BamB